MCIRDRYKVGHGIGGSKPRGGKRFEIIVVEVVVFLRHNGRAACVLINRNRKAYNE